MIFALAATLVWAVLIPHISRKAEEKELQPIDLPEEAAPGEEDGTGEAEPPVYITETVSMELNDYHKMYQQLMQIGSQVEKSLVNISAVSTDTDWFDESLTTQNSVCGTVVGDNGVELLLLTQYQEIRNAETLLVTFYDHTTAKGTLKKYDKNTGLAVVGVNLGDIGGDAGHHRHIFRRKYQQQHTKDRCRCHPFLLRTSIGSRRNQKNQQHQRQIASALTVNSHDSKKLQKEHLPSGQFLFSINGFQAETTEQE